MRGLRRLFLALTLCALAGCGGFPLPGEVYFDFPDDADPALAAQPFVENELLVQAYPGADAARVAELIAEAGAEVIDELAEIELTVLEVEPGRLAATAAMLDEAGLFEAINKNYLFEAEARPNDPMLANQSWIDALNLPAAWDETTGSRFVPIAILDTGVDIAHPDLVEKVVDRWNVVAKSDDVTDSEGHGTAVAGIAAASTDNGEGVAGVSWNSPLLVGKVVNSKGRTSSRHLAAGILWASNGGAKVINVSFAPLHGNRVVRAAARVAFNRGGLVVISTGNAGKTYTSKGYDQALFIGAVTSTNRRAGFSNYGPFVDFVAPGATIRSTAPGGEYRSRSGTSFSSPIVAGVAALCWSVNRNLRPTTIIEILQDTSRDLGDEGEDDEYGVGLINAAAAVQEAVTITEREDTAAPFPIIRSPKSGARVTGPFVIKVDVAEDQTVADVVLAVDGIPVATDTAEPYQFVVETTDYSLGTHALSATASDAAGNSATSEVVEVTFVATSGGGTDAPPTDTLIEFLSPSAGQTVSGDVRIDVRVSDADGLTAIEWFVDGVPRLTAGASGDEIEASFFWDTEDESSGSHTIVLTATDSRGNRVSGNLSLSVR